MTHQHAKALVSGLRKARYNEQQVPQVVDHILDVLDYLLKVSPKAGDEVEE